MTTVETVTYTAPAISCAHCQRTIEAAVRALPGVQRVHVEIPAKDSHRQLRPHTSHA